MGFSTDAVHAGQEPEPRTGAVMTPIFATSTYAHVAGNEDGAFDYSRVVNPTRTALEANLAALEGGAHGACFASGMAAIDALVRLFDAGDHVVVSENVYGGTYRLFETVMRRQGIDFAWVDTSDPAAVAEAMRDRTRLVLVETPTNPMMTLTDIEAVAGLCRKRGVLLAVDNTFMTPFFQRPLDLGADLVVHSTTKYLNGHSDSLGGVVVTSNEEAAEGLRHIQKSAGAVLSPFEAFLILRGVKTLAVRMERHDRNGRCLAAWLEGRPEVERVCYPGLPSHPQHDLAGRQMSGFGGMISFDVGSRERAEAVMAGVEVFAKAESLGGVESLICLPATMTHASIPADRAERMGMTHGLLRISVGIEDLEDLQADLEQALAG